MRDEFTASEKGQGRLVVIAFSCPIENSAPAAGHEFSAGKTLGCLRKVSAWCLRPYLADSYPNCLNDLEHTVEQDGNLSKCILLQRSILEAR